MLIYYPDPILSKVSTPVNQFDISVQALVDIMYKEMERYNGVGLSAIQLGVEKNIFVLSIDGEKQTVINPKILHSFDDWSYENEGCLSVPGEYTRIRRPEKVTTKFFNEKGEEISKTYSGLWSRAFQHEFDHLQGMTFFDRMNSLQLRSVLKKYNRRK